MRKISTVIEQIKKSYAEGCCQVSVIGSTHGDKLLLLLGIGLLYQGLQEVAVAQINPPLPGGSQITVDTSEIERARCAMYALLEGPYGALLTATAGLSAIVSAVMGGYRSAYTFMSVGIGCFVARSLDSMYFGSPDCPGKANDIIQAVDQWKASAPYLN